MQKCLPRNTILFEQRKVKFEGLLQGCEITTIIFVHFDQTKLNVATYFIFLIKVYYYEWINVKKYEKILRLSSLPHQIQ